MNSMPDLNAIGTSAPSEGLACITIMLRLLATILLKMPGNNMFLCSNHTDNGSLTLRVGDCHSAHNIFGHMFMTSSILTAIKIMCHDDNVPPPAHSSLLALIVGSSHIRRTLELLNERKVRNLGLNTVDYECILYGRGGLRYLTYKWSRSIISKLRIIDSIHPELVILQLGSNDLPEFSESDIIETMLDISEFCLESGARRVVLCTLWNREDDQYNYHVEILNQLLPIRVQEHGNPNIYVWKHRGLTDPIYDFLIDGTHLTTYYYWKLYRSLRGAVMYHRKDLRGLFY